MPGKNPLAEPNLTLAEFVTERRAALGLTLTELGRRITREDGKPATAADVHYHLGKSGAVSPHIIGELARVLGVERWHLAALAGEPPADIVAYLHEHPESAAAVASMFTRARSAGFSDWDKKLEGSAGDPG